MVIQSKSSARVIVSSNRLKLQIRESIRRQVKIYIIMGNALLSTIKYLNSFSIQGRYFHLLLGHNEPEHTTISPSLLIAGAKCERRMLHIPYKPLSQRMLQEPFWLGLITVFVVLGVLGLFWCAKRHFPEKLEKLLAEEADRTRHCEYRCMVFVTFVP